jgi:tetrahydromethanopterin S-methyltransferase subunit B
MARITNAMRDSITADVIRWSKPINDLEKKIQDLSDQFVSYVYTYVMFSAKEIRLLGEMPDYWVTETRQLTILTDLKEGFKDTYHYITSRHTITIPRGVYITSFEYKKLSPKAREMFRTIYNHKQKLGELKQTVRDVLQSVNTTKKLIEQWPEIEHIVAKYATIQGGKLISKKLIDTIKKEINPIGEDDDVS